MIRSTHECVVYRYNKGVVDPLVGAFNVMTPIPPPYSAGHINIYVSMGREEILTQNVFILLHHSVY